MTFQRMDDTFKGYLAKIDSAAGSLVLSADTTGAPDPTNRPAAVRTTFTLRYRRIDHEHLIIDGPMGGQDMHLVLTFHDPDSFLQRSRGFHWVSEGPFNR